MENKSESAGDEAHDEKEHSRGCPTVSKGEKKVLLQEYSMHRKRERENALIKKNLVFLNIRIQNNTYSANIK